MNLLDFPRRAFAAVKDRVFRAEMAEVDSRWQEWQRQLNAGRLNPPRRGTAEAMEFFKVSPILRSAAQLVANSLASTRWRVLMPTRKSDGQPVQNGPADWYRLRHVPPGPERTAELAALRRAGLCKTTGEVEQMIASSGSGDPSLPLSRMLGRNLAGYDGRTLLMQAEIYRIITGEIAILTATDGTTTATGKTTPVAGMAIPPTWLQEVPRPDSPFFRIVRGTLSEQVPEDRVIWHRTHDLADPLDRGIGAVSTLATELEIDEQAAGVIREWMAAGPQGGAIVSVPSGNVGELEAQWKKAQKGRQKGAPFFISGSSEVTIRELQNMQTLSQTSAVRVAQFDMVRAYMGLPPELFGILANSNRSTIDAAWEIFCRVCLIPTLEVWRGILQGTCDYYFGEGLYLIDYPSPIPDNREQLLAAAAAFPAAITVGEIRTKIMGLPVFGDERDQLVQLPPGYRFTRDLLAEADQPDSEPEVPNV